MCDWDLINTDKSCSSVCLLVINGIESIELLHQLRFTWEAKFNISDECR